MKTLCQQAMEQRHTAAAVACLRTQLAALAPPCSPIRLHQLTACLLASSTAELHALAGWPAGTTSAAQRQPLLQALQVCDAASKAASFPGLLSRQARPHNL